MRCVEDTEADDARKANGQVNRQDMGHQQDLPSLPLSPQMCQHQKLLGMRTGPATMKVTLSHGKGGMITSVPVTWPSPGALC